MSTAPLRKGMLSGTAGFYSIFVEFCLAPRERAFSLTLLPLVSPIPQMMTRYSTVAVLCPSFPLPAAHFITHVAAEGQPSLNVGRIQRRRELTVYS